MKFVARFVSGSPGRRELAVKSLAEYLELATRAHGHLCAGQVLGVRLAMLGLRELGIDDPIAERKRLVTYVEIDRCVTDAVAVVANCRLGKRALKFRDWGKVAATFVDLQTAAPFASPPKNPPSKRRANSFLNLARRRANKKLTRNFPMKPCSTSNGSKWKSRRKICPGSKVRAWSARNAVKASTSNEKSS